MKTTNSGIGNQPFQQLEIDYANYVNTKHACVVNTGTAALHLSGYALNWNKNDIIITSPISFVASSNAAIYHGAIPLFVDIDENTSNLCIKKLKIIKI